jgi:hypothetical protein
MTLEDLSLILVTVLLFSPETAESHLVWLLPVLVTTWMPVFQKRAAARAMPLTAVSAVLLLAQMYFVGVTTWRSLADARVWTICLATLLVFAALDAIRRSSQIAGVPSAVRAEA